jgi:hypothetical protein
MPGSKVLYTPVLVGSGVGVNVTVDIACAAGVRSGCVGSLSIEPLEESDNWEGVVGAGFCSNSRDVSAKGTARETAAASRRTTTRIDVVIPNFGENRAVYLFIAPFSLVLKSRATNQLLCERLLSNILYAVVLSISRCLYFTRKSYAACHCQSTPCSSSQAATGVDQMHFNTSGRTQR